MSRKWMSTKVMDNTKKISTALEEFAEKMKLENKSKYTIYTYKEIINRFIKVIGDKEISKVNSKDIDKLVKYLSPTNRNTSINTNLIHINVFINNFAKSRSYNKGFKIQRLKAEQCKKEVYSKEEIVRLLTPNPKETFMQMQMRVIIATFCSTALRVSELISLQVKDVDIKEGIIYTRHTKTNKPRITPISKSLSPLMQEWLQKRQYLTEEDTLFCNVFGEPLKRSVLQTGYYRYAKRKGLEQTGLHKFRRTFITHSVNNNIDIIRLARITGHTQLKTLSEYYVSSKKEVKKLADKVSILEDLEKPRKAIKKDGGGR
ncbi:tyrosine-type recombinase/integrase [Clostridium sp. MSJ-11]|uniref:Tyrosine-type recombinase/integrase n=1 Tax=Clostridium mobile TaxID=2841512 RepID=A0ABS6EMK9_9CLOT|nr:tyrosine-type recombinase/integrase [Clostridium mobile]MBU5485992.1 tyrosine-type recombinase/integrase [Clostridium mobile]